MRYSSRWVAGVPLLAYALVLVRTAWLADDAFITFRVMDNWVNGFGLRWNTVERVQAFTNPLWLFWVTGFYVFTREIFYTPLLVSITTSLLAGFILVTRLADNVWLAVTSVCFLVSSKAFVDYSTSGLENPLTYLLLLVFLVVYLRQPHTDKTIFWLALTASLAALNRMDTLLLLTPSLGYAAWQVRNRQGWSALGLGFVPLGIWELFSLWYYGFPFPNTAYAKLWTGIPQGELALAGTRYLLNALKTDPLTPLTIAAGILVPLYQKNRRHTMVGAGIALYLLYLVRIGGDFMAGRFLAAPFLGALVVLVRSETCSSARACALVGAVILGIGLCSSNPPLLSDAEYGHGIVLQDINDERATYYRNASLLRALTSTPDGTEFPTHGWATIGRMLKAHGAGVQTSEGYFIAPADYGTRVVTVARAVGYAGFFAGPRVHIVDAYGLADPLIARLPAYQTASWRPGHLERIVPDGYLESLVSDQNRIADKNLSTYYDKLCVLTRSGLWDWSRFAEIWRFNTGGYDHLINYDAYRHPTPVEIALNGAKIKANDPAAFIVLGKELFKDSRPQDAAVALQAALQIDPDNIPNYCSVGDLFRANQREDLALGTYREAIHRGRADLEEYAREKDQNQQNRGNYYSTCVGLAYALMATGDSATAATVYRQAGAIAPASPKVQKKLADFLSALDGLQETGK